jgi:hypothetical protein
MENASKALIIAGAILISILIISFGVIILGQGSDVVNNADMSDSEKVTFNAKFEAYEGDNVKGNKVKQMAKAVATHNRTEQDNAKKVWVMVGALPNSVPTSFNVSRAVIKDDGAEGNFNYNGKIGLDGLEAGKTYTVKCLYDSNNGIIKAIYILLNS